MNKISKLLSITMLSAAASVCFADDNTVVATYNDIKVTEKEVVTKMLQQPQIRPMLESKSFSELDQGLRGHLVRNFVIAKLVEKKAKEEKIKETAEFAKKLEETKDQLAQQILLEKVINESVTEKAVADEYNKMVAELKGKKEIKASHILVETEEKAKEIKAKLDKGGKFEELAAEYSMDEGSKNKGGELEYFGEGQLVPEFEKAAFSMKAGELSAPVKSQFGWHIIKVKDVRALEIPPKSEVESGIKGGLQKKAVEKYVDSLLEKADLKITVEYPSDKAE